MFKFENFLKDIKEFNEEFKKNKNNDKNISKEF